MCNKNHEIQKGHTLIRPPIITQLSLPSPKHPPLLSLIRSDLRRKPLLIELSIRIRIPVRVRLDIIRDSQTPFTHDKRGVAVQIIAAGSADVVIMGSVDVSPFQVAMVVVSGVVEIVQVLVGIAGAPGFVHHLDVQVVVSVD